eukprot:COSAG06_NODE_1823_length_8286_cov_32.294613_7_plen_75_part_00
MPVTPEATAAEKSRDPDARENKIKNFERGDLLTLDRAMAAQGALPEVIPHTIPSPSTPIKLSAATAHPPDKTIS